MAYVLRYFMNYNDNASGLPVVVNIYYPDFAGTALELIPAESPCSVSELNSDDKIFSAIRAKEFRIKFVTDNFIYPGIIDFATNSDTDWKVDILVDGNIWLTGFILTDQISEMWLTDGMNHYIELVASDNIGTLKKLALKDIDGNDFIPTSKQFLIDIVKAALNQAVDRLPINIFDNLFEVNFDDRIVIDTNDSYQQCKVDMRTFTTNYSSFDNAYSVLTKVLESRNSVLFQHIGEWYIVRVSELFRVDTINGTRYDVDDTMTAINSASWLSDLSQSGDIVPVDQFMIKSFSNPVLSNRVNYKYTNFDELFCNELWKRGAIIVNTTTLKEYGVDCWNHYEGAIISTTPATVLFRRRDVIVADTDVVTESYIYLEYETAAAHESFVISEPAQVSKDDKLNISFSRRLKNGYTGSGTEILARVLLYGDDGTYYTLDDDGLWYLSNVSFTVNAKFLVSLFSAGDDRAVWREKVVDCDFIPKSGRIRIMLYEGSASAFTGQETHFRDLKVTYKSYLEGKTFVNVEGDYNQLTLATTLKDTAEYDTYLSDSPKYLFKGALFLADGLTLTSLWYEMSDPSTEYPIKRWKAIDYYRLSHRNMLKADGVFYKWIKVDPINSIQKLTISNGAADKRFMPAFIRDIDTSRSRFNSLLLEVFDETKDIVTTYISHDEIVTTTSEYSITEMIGIAPDTLQFTYTPFPQPYFLAGDSVLISGTGVNDGTVIINSIAISGDTYTMSVTSSPSIADHLMTGGLYIVSRDITITVTEPVITYPVNAIHKFDYIFKAK